MYNVEKTQKRKLTGKDDNTPTPKKCGRPKKVINLKSRYSLVRPQEGSDSTADARNMQALQLEMEKAKPRKEVVLPLMKATFYSRRHYILNGTESVVKILGAISLTENSICGKMVCACVLCACTCLCVAMRGFVPRCVCTCMCVSVCENSTHCLWVLFAIVKFIVNRDL